MPSWSSTLHWVWVLGLMLVSSVSGAERAVDFARDVQPILAAKCYECHGADMRKGGLRLDLKRDALMGGDDGAIIVPGKSAESLIFKKVSATDSAKRMPPKGEPLTAQQIATLQKWIDAGAVWPDEAGAVTAKAQSQHWAFQAVKRVEPPKVKQAKWVANPIDAFVLARLEQEKIKPSPEADRYTLVRRLSLDLLGLPPTVEEVETFVNDKSPDAYRKLVERTLASPHFGERWGRHWLDMARYADSDGYEKDRARPFAYVYRDWVIRAINEDMPFDRFSIEQLAGDLLTKPTHEQIVATGFHRQTLTNTEGGVDQEEFRTKAVVDRVSTTSTVWLGLTMACAECHTHKYDPITQREFYQFYAFFNNASEKNVPSPQVEEQAKYNEDKAKWDIEDRKLKAQLAEYVKKDLPAKQGAWEKTAQVKFTPWAQLKPAKVASENGATLKAQKDYVVVSDGKLPDTDTYTVEVTPEAKRITGFRLEAIDDPKAKKGPGRAKDGNFVLTKFSVKAVSPDGEEREVKLGNPQATFSQSKFPVANALAGDAGSGWAVSPKFNESHAAVFETAEDLVLPEGAKLVFTLEHKYKTTYLLGQFRLAATDAARPLKADMTPAGVASALAKSADLRTKQESVALAKYYQEQVDVEARKIQAFIDAHAKKAPAAPATTAAVMVEEAEGRKTQVHVRGNFMDKGAEVQPGVPSVLPVFKARSEKADRLDLANWLFDPANPLTGRVTVNHIWKNLFGRGLVNTVDDFGTRGDKPSHPELLDWLASEFPRLKWSRKEMIKLIVMSNTYRQESVVRPELMTRDPLNTLLARQNRLRLEAESVRDAYLAASGLLARKVGGPSIKPALPDDIAALGYANSVKWQESKGEDKYRRGLYIFFQRTVPYPMLMTFDAPDSTVACMRRERSNTPLQALTLLNDPVFFECAQALGLRMADVPTSDASAKISEGFQYCFGRVPSKAEGKRLEELYTEQVKLLESRPENAKKLVGTKTADADAPQKAALVALARVMLNLDEFITRE
ncbi:MAG TPA: PSD1 and planctomycete cytochrome C domain-containing protein [Verrucomicrobiae bacterium]